VRTFALVIGLLLVSCAAHSETDVFMRAVGFALTGSDDADVKAIDRANCIFAYRQEVFHLNNVHTDRIKIQAWENKLGDGWINVDLHGDDVVLEKPISSESHKQYQLRLKTADADRVKRAWEYIYAHGCIGKKSPF
jgi:hypothetical protein